MKIKKLVFEGGSQKDLCAFPVNARRRAGHELLSVQISIGEKKMTHNVFKDLGFEPAEANSLKLRSELMLAIKKYIKTNKLTQAQAAKIMGVDQPRINKLLAGHIELFTIDKLVTMLERAKIHVTLNLAA